MGSFYLTSGHVHAESDNRFAQEAHARYGGHARRADANKDLNNNGFPPDTIENGIAAGLIQIGGPGGGGKSGSHGDTTALAGGDCTCSSDASWMPEWDQASEADPWCTLCNP